MALFFAAFFLSNAAKQHIKNETNYDTPKAARIYTKLSIPKIDDRIRAMKQFLSLPEMDDYLIRASKDTLDEYAKTISEVSWNSLPPFTENQQESPRF